jgi:outer membrane receptor protein involved in Fe transport
VCKGVVKDNQGETVIGASVVVKGSTNGTITGLDGDFTLDNVKRGDVIQISYIGYVSQEVVWQGTPLNITLKEDSQTLEEVVVVGFGSQKKANLTGSVSQVKMDDVLGERPVTNVKNALQGSMPGLMVSGGASPGEAKSFNIRGTVSINGMNPLVLIDNVEGDIDLLNPEDIESVTVLKSTAST